MIVVYTIKDWREWLIKNHLKEKKVKLISYKKHTGKPFISHRDAMREAIAFGWIDTTIKRLDDEKYIRSFVRRGDKANWSKNTLRYGKVLFEAGRMSEHGILRYKQGLKKRPHDYGIPDKPNMPLELRKELEKNKKAKENFNSVSPSTKTMLYRSILRAKTPETKMKRIREIIGSTINTK